MALFRIMPNGIESVAETNFTNEKIMERGDLQRLLRHQIEIISPDTRIIAEEFGEFEGVRRRIDLLGIDKEANLVVIELKRTEDGGHMELQAIRYAAMVSTMTFKKAVDVYTRYLASSGQDIDPEESLLEFLGWDEVNEEDFGQDVRIILASAEFSNELTAAVLWLNERNIDITCFRLKPYKLNDEVLLDVQKIIPLPESAEYQVEIREKKKKERESKESTKDFTKYDVIINGIRHESLPKRRAIYAVVRKLCSEGVTPDDIHQILHWRGNGLWRIVEGKVDSETFKETALKSAANGGPAFEPRRWYYADDELIFSGNKSYAFTKMWGRRTEEAMSALLERYSNFDITFDTFKK